MSLKAKVEAVIYAAEEPITVDQIAQLLRDQILAEQARLEAEAQAAAEAKAAEEAQNFAKTEAAVVEEATSVEAAESATAEDNTPTLSIREEDPASAEVAEEVADAGGDQSSSDASASEPATPEAQGTAESVEASTPVADEASPEVLAEAAQREPSPAENASVDAPAVPGKRQKKTKEEIAVDAKVRAHVRALIAELIADYESEDRGIEVRQVAGGYRMSTKPEHHDVVRAFAKSLKPPVRLSLAALETLAVIAYKQPITVPEISEIRGVESGGVIATLLDRKLITTAGRKQVIGRPILYKTAKEFLLRFGLNDVSELPSMEEFEKLAAEGLGGGEEQAHLDLQSPAAENVAVSTEQAEEGNTPLKPTEDLNGAPGEAAPVEEPATTEIAESASQPNETAPAQETQLGSETEEPQHS